jgi:hypothetical protein
MVILLRGSILLVLCASYPFLSIFQVFLPHPELTNPVYVDVVASVIITILPVSNHDVTTFVYLNASAVRNALLYHFAK